MFVTHWKDIARARTSLADSERMKNLAWCLLALVGCAAGGGEDGEVSEAALSMSEADAASVLALVNYPATDAAVLDNQVGLDARAAKNIIAYRNGADGVAPSPDDNTFEDVAELDAIPYVADRAFASLRTYAAAHPAPAGELVEGVAFTGWESEAVVWGVNHADVAFLSSMLDTRAANGLVAKRPFASVTAMGPVPYVAATALGKLRTNARAWWNASHQPAGYVLTAENLASITDRLKESLWGDEGFANVVVGLAGGDNDVATRIMTGLEAEIDHLAAPMLGMRFYDADAAYESVSIASPVKQRTKIGGWTYLESIGVSH